MRIHEIIIEHDEGSPWATLSEHRPQMLLTGKTTLVSVEKNDAVQRMTFYVKPFNTNTIEGIEVKWTVSLTKGIDRIDFKSKIYWDTYNERVRIAFPTKLKGKHLYEIPYGTLERQPYEPNFDNWYCSNGDWPAINWVGVSTEKGSVALLNKGIPSHKIEKSENGDTIYISLLRSPSVPTYLHEPRSYNMTGYDGMRDVGIHEFEYALVTYDESLEKSAVVPEAATYNMPFIVSTGKAELPLIPVLESENVQISAVTTDETGALILRLFEFRGIGGSAKLHLPESIVHAYLIQLNGKEICELDIKESVAELEARPFEILTVRLPEKGR
jgi:alpha-mannosidase